MHSYAVSYRNNAIVIGSKKDNFKKIQNHFIQNKIDLDQVIFEEQDGPIQFTGTLNAGTAINFAFDGTW